MRSDSRGESDDLVAGDVRAIVQPGLASIHTLFLREHNRYTSHLNHMIINVSYPRIADILADELKNELRGKSVKERDNIIYEETRRIVTAEIQNIVFNEYLPTLLGQDAVDKLGINLDAGTAYNEKLDASIMNEFATAAMRFGHSTVSGFFKPIGHKNWPLKFHYFDFKEFVLGQGGLGCENELHGMVHQPSQKADLVTTDDMTDFLLWERDSGSKVGDDIMARNIQRGRDHGIPSYNTMRQACKLQKLTSFRSRPREISAKDWTALAGVYDDVDDVDLITGGLAETPSSGALIGPTFSCIIAKQFHSNEIDFDVVLELFCV